MSEVCHKGCVVSVYCGEIWSYYTARKFKSVAMVTSLLVNEPEGNYN